MRSWPGHDDVDTCWLRPSGEVSSAYPFQISLVRLSWSPLLSPSLSTYLLPLPLCSLGSRHHSGSVATLLQADHVMCCAVAVCVRPLGPLRNTCSCLGCFYSRCAFYCFVCERYNLFGLYVCTYVCRYVCVGSEGLGWM